MFRSRFILLALVTTLCRTFAEFSATPKVTLSHGGMLVGSQMSSVNGKGIHGYRGIPYAEPPVGKLRFQAPVPVQSWSGEKLANKDAELCPQQNSFLRIFTTIGNEDCLYLNVYTPKERTQKEPLSVMVFLHGGAYMAGGGISKLYGPDRILDADNIILVTGNYRLGPLGFLSTGTRDCPGNNGLKDQVLILKWVRDNIATFGGNPNDVTIVGESAGGGSVAHHMSSPLAEGLFHKAILQSGTNFDWWSLDERPVASAYAAKLGKLLNCSTAEENWKEMIECLRTKTTDEIISTLKDFFEFDIDPILIFKPVVEPDISGSFITTRPDVAVKYSRNIPIMIGLTADEGVIRTGPLLNLKNDEFKEKFNEVLPILLY